MQKNGAPIPHVLIFPLPIQGAVNSMLKLAELLIFATDDIHVTFLTTEHVYNRLQLAAQTTTRLNRNPRLSVHAFSDGLPEDHIRGGDKFWETIQAVKDVSQSLIEKLLLPSNTNTLKHPFTYIIAEGLFDFAVDVGNQAGIPVVYFDTISPCCLWVHMCFPQLIEAGEVPKTDKQELDTLVDVVPGMETFLRRRDLPKLRPGCEEINIQQILTEVKQFQRAQGIILNTFYDLEPTLLSHMTSHCLNQVYTLGPIHLHLQRKMQNDSLLMSSTCSNSFWKEDKGCMSWLDQQPPRSVIYCSFGSQVVLTKQQLTEFWHGLVNSGSKFLWVKRPGSVIGIDDDDDDFKKWSKEMDTDLIDEIERKGLIVSWAPQEEVLSHYAVGGFLTHSGWNSTIESITNGIPMVCRPNYIDQLVNSRVVSEVWKVGVEIKDDNCDRFTIEKAVKEVMDLRKNEFLENAARLANLAKRSVDEGGSSYHSLECLIKDIRSFKLLMPNSCS